jgi:hypothetical protein
MNLPSEPTNEAVPIPKRRTRAKKPVAQIIRSEKDIVVEDDEIEILLNLRQLSEEMKVQVIRVIMAVCADDKEKSRASRPRLTLVKGNAG